MATLYPIPYVLGVGSAPLAASPVLTVLPGILWGKLMAVFAMSFCAVARPISSAAKSKTRFVNLFFGQKNFLNGPTEVDTLINGLGWDSKFSRPLHRGLSFAAKLKKAINPSIAHLASTSRPSAIRRFIMSIIVNPINGHSIGRMPHISKKIRQTIKPSIAYFYAAPSVVFVRMIVRIKAALFNPVPYRLNTRATKPVGGVVGMNFSKMRQLFFGNHNNSPLGDCNMQREWSQS